MVKELPMVPPKDAAYFIRRAEESSRLARESTDPAVRLIHLRMAVSYERLAGLRDITTI
jgi:hypothetical protein